MSFEVWVNVALFWMVMKVVVDGLCGMWHLILNTKEENIHELSVTAFYHENVTVFVFFLLVVNAHGRSDLKI